MKKISFQDKERKSRQDMKNRIGSIFNYLGALLILTFGLIYLFKDSFMAYHSEAISLQWDELDKNIQFLILALMRGVGGGLILSGVMIIWLQVKFNKTKLTWIPPLILAAGTITGLTALYASLIVRINTPGNPPTILVIAGLLVLLFGYLLNRNIVLN